MLQPTVTLLHLSDVHFQRKKIDGTYDLDRELRNELELSLVELAATFKVTGIIVTGDIAFAGDPREFEAARAWLRELATIVGCREEAVWVVCGNHDIDRRNVIEKSHSVQLLQAHLRENVDRLAALQADPQAAATLFSPLANYNEFAEKYGCDFGPDRLVWKHDLELNDGSKLRLVGLNSTLTSCRLDDENVRLVLGDMSHAILRERGVALVTLCHHPPDWLFDHDQVTSLLNTRTRLQLFGHKHMQRIERLNDSLKVTAGAVHPERAEKHWDPRFNIIELKVNTTGVRTLDVTVNAMVWSKATRKFTKDTTDPLANIPISLPLESWTPPAQQTAPLEVDVNSAALSSRSVMDPARRLTYRFLTLPYHERVAVANVLGLLRDEDKGVSDRVLFERILRRATELGQLGALWDEVERRHSDRTEEPNPYEGR